MIEELKELMAEDFPLLIETFITDCDKRLVDIKLAIADGNATEVRELAHGFKGSSSNLGAEKLSEISYIIESMGRDDNMLGVEDANALLTEEYQQVKEYFNSLL